MGTTTTTTTKTKRRKKFYIFMSLYPTCIWGFYIGYEDEQNHFKLAGSSKPEEYEEFEFLMKEDFNVIITTTESRLNIPENFRSKIQHYHLPIIEFYAPNLELIEEFVRIVEDVRKGNSSSNVLLHCRGGLGRTGTLMACYLIFKHGLNPRE